MENPRHGERSPTGEPPAPEGSDRSEVSPAPADSPAEQRAGAEGEVHDAEVVEHDLDALLADTKRERDEYLELAQRARADFENYRKRAARETREAESRGKAAIARELVPALDNLERALRAVGIDLRADGAAPAPGDVLGGEGTLARGVALVRDELATGLERAGVEAFDPTGERFDPELHEALATRPAEGTEPGVVLETLEKGYRLDGQVLRAARVVVSE